MNFASVFSGIEAASVAWSSLDWRPMFYAEIEPHPCHVLAHRHHATRPLYMPDPEEHDLSHRDRRARRAAISAVRGLPDLGDGRIPNLGDVSQFRKWPDYAIDVLIGGSPCQSFSVAGLREGLADPRGNLLLTYLAIVERYSPRWVVWENVPGVLSSGDGRDFAALLGGLGQLGYGWAYRVLDAQFCRALRLPYAVPQRRRRVFVVAYLGDWRRAAAVLFDGASLRGDSPPRREAGKDVAGTLAVRAGGGGHPDGGDGRHSQLVPEVSPALKARDDKGPSSDGDGDGAPLVPEVSPTLRAGGNDTGGDRPPGTDVDTVETLVPVAFKPSHYTRDKDGAPSTVTPALSADADKGDQDPLVLAPEPIVFQPRFARNDRGAPSTGAAHALTSEAGTSGKGDSAQVVAQPIAFHGSQDPDVSGDVTHPLGRNHGQEATVAIPFDTTQITHPENRSNPRPGDPSGTIAKDGHAPAVAFSITPSNSNKDYSVREVDKAQALTSASGGTPSARGGDIIAAARQFLWRVRRLTPRECERLQGFPDDFTDVPWRGRDTSPDGPRYRELGNSMATNVVEIIGERIARVDRQGDN